MHYCKTKQQNTCSILYVMIVPARIQNDATRALETVNGCSANSVALISQLKVETVSFLQN